MTPNLRVAICAVVSAATLLALLLPVFAVLAQAGTPQETLKQYISDLQKSPNDNALREKIIRHVQTMQSAPAIPEAAREHYVMAATFVEKAKDNSGYERAIEHYKAALLAAPWWADAYKKQAIVQKTATHYDDAIASLNLYILTQPADARDAQDEIYKLKALKQSAAEDQLKKQREEQQREAPKILVRQLKSQYNGASYSTVQCSYAAQSRCFNEVGVFPCGCNDAEFHSQYWYDSDIVRCISFPEDGTILFTYIWLNKSYIELRGTPKGPTIKDIVWEQNKNMYNDMEPVWKPVWVDLLDNLDRLVYSPDHFQVGPGRPIDNALYSRSQRYSYRLLKKR